jgi:hypothetical protein
MAKVVLRHRFYVSADAVDRVALKRHAEVADTSKRIGRMGPRTALSDAPAGTLGGGGRSLDRGLIMLDRRIGEPSAVRGFRTVADFRIGPVCQWSMGVSPGPNATNLTQGSSYTK